MRVTASMLMRPGPFGLAIMEVRPPSMPHVLLPLEPHPLATWISPAALRAAIGEAIPTTIVSFPPVSPATPEQLRESKELEARRSAQPDGWGDRTYQSVTGLRWRCCWNLFEDDHAPWCPAGNFPDPLPPA